MLERLENPRAEYAIKTIYFTDMKKIRIRNVLICAYALIIAGILFLFALNGRYYVKVVGEEYWAGMDKWTGKPVQANQNGIY